MSPLSSLPSGDYPEATRAEKVILKQAFEVARATLSYAEALMAFGAWLSGSASPRIAARSLQLSRTIR